MARWVGWLGETIMYTVEMLRLQSNKKEFGVPGIYLRKTVALDDPFVAMLMERAGVFSDEPPEYDDPWITQLWTRLKTEWKRIHSVVIQDLFKIADCLGVSIYDELHNFYGDTHPLQTEEERRWLKCLSDEKNYEKTLRAVNLLGDEFWHSADDSYSSSRRVWIAWKVRCDFVGVDKDRRTKEQAMLEEEFKEKIITGPRNTLKPWLIENLILTHQVTGATMRWLFHTPSERSFYGYEPTVEALVDRIMLMPEPHKDLISVLLA